MKCNEVEVYYVYLASLPDIQVWTIKFETFPGRLKLWSMKRFRQMKTIQVVSFVNVFFVLIFNDFIWFNIKTWSLPAWLINVWLKNDKKNLLNPVLK